jgi:hypothetical protein
MADRNGRWEEGQKEGVGSAGGRREHAILLPFSSLSAPMHHPFVNEIMRGSNWNLSRAHDQLLRRIGRSQEGEWIPPAVGRRRRRLAWPSARLNGPPKGRAVSPSGLAERGRGSAGGRRGHAILLPISFPLSFPLSFPRPLAGARPTLRVGVSNGAR